MDQLQQLILERNAELAAIRQLQQQQQSDFSWFREAAITAAQIRLSTVEEKIADLQRSKGINYTPPNDVSVEIKKGQDNSVLGMPTQYLVGGAVALGLVLIIMAVSKNG